MQKNNDTFSALHHLPWFKRKKVDNSLFLHKKISSQNAQVRLIKRIVMSLSYKDRARIKTALKVGFIISLFYHLSNKHI